MRLLSEDPGLSFLLRSDQAFLALPELAVKRLREMVERSRAFLLRSLRDGAREGSIRKDIESELLLVPVMGTIHALIGTSGVRGQVDPVREKQVERVLAALLRLLSPPNS